MTKDSKKQIIIKGAKEHNLQKSILSIKQKFAKYRFSYSS